MALVGIGRALRSLAADEVALPAAVIGRSTTIPSISVGTARFASFSLGRFRLQPSAPMTPMIRRSRPSRAPKC